MTTMMRVALVAAFTVICTLAVAAPASASPTCHGASCVRQDPQATGCAADATTKTEFTYGDVRVEMRHSAACDAVWTRVSSPTHYDTYFAQIRSYYDNAGSRKDVAGVQVTPGTHWTVMFQFSTQWIKSCLGSWFNSVPFECTGYR